MAKRITINKVNGEVIKPIPLLGKEVDKRPTRGAEIFAQPFVNCFLAAKRKSGKTTAENHILRKICGPKTHVLIFCSTVYRDDGWINIVKWLKSKNIACSTFTSILDDTGADRVRQFLDEQSQIEEDVKERDTKERKKNKLIIYTNGDSDDEEEPKERKEKYISPDYIFCFDDVSTEIRSPAVSQLLKTGRHLKATVLISSQYWLDCTPMQRKQMCYALLFKGHPIDKLKTIYKDLDLSVSFQLFHELYTAATIKPFNFLFVDVRNEKFRWNFDKQFNIPS